MKKKFSTNIIIIIISIVALGANAFYLMINVMAKHRKIDEEILEPGLQFIGMKEHLDGVEKIGYLTNNDLSPENNQGHFLQAQYYFAPTVIELNKSDNHYNILDYSNVNFLVYKLGQINSKVVHDNMYSKVLAEKRP